MHKKHRGAGCNGLPLPHERLWRLPRELLHMVLQFLIGDLGTWHMLLQVSRQFKECVLDPPSLTHVKAVMCQHYDRARLVPGLRTLRLQTYRANEVMAKLNLSPPMSLQTLDMSGRGSTPDPPDRGFFRGVRGGTITNLGLNWLACIPTLTAVDLTNCPEISDVGIRALGPLAGTLQILNLSSCPGITNQALQWLPGNSLRRLYLSDCDQITDAGVMNLARHSGLQELGVRRCVITDDGVKSFAPLVQLQSLDFTFCNLITDVGIRALDPLVALQNLSLFGCDEVSLECLRARPWAGTVRTLDLRRCSMGNTDVTAFYPFRRLQTISLGVRAVCDTAVQSLSQLAAVRTLNLTRCRSLTGIAALSRMKDLLALDLSRCSAVTDASLECMNQLSVLQTLSLSMNRGVTDSGVLLLSRALPVLRTLDLTHCTITDFGMQHLSRMVTLHRLEVAFCDAITNQGVRRLLSLVELQSLNLSGDWRVTTIGVTALRPLLALRDVLVRECPSVEYCGSNHFRVRTS